VPDGLDIAVRNVTAGQSIIVSGTMGDHGVAVLSKRENLEFETEICSDSAALHDLVADMVAAVPAIAMLRDPTRGGLSATLNEIATTAGVGMMLQEAQIPVSPDVAAACELLGLDPLNTANEGKLIAICPRAEARTLLAAMRAHPLGQSAAIIGETVTDPAHLVQMQTAFGGIRIVDWLAGEQLPRIC
jgi:hydrogenase expression/formation protein HypE